MNRFMREFVETTGELLGSDQVRMMGRWKHHGPITTLDHSLFVAYLSFRAARALGLDETAAARGGLLHRIRCAGAILSTMVSWALENGIDTADSMKSRGYGLPGRTAFSIYRFDRRDRLALAALLALGAAVLAGAALDGLTWRYFPTVKWSGGPVSLLTLTAYLALCAVPVILDRREDRKWTALRWKI